VAESQSDGGHGSESQLYLTASTLLSRNCEIIICLTLSHNLHGTAYLDIMFCFCCKGKELELWFEQVDQNCTLN
jgi:hypothetical protein